MTVIEVDRHAVPRQASRIAPWVVAAMVISSGMAGGLIATVAGRGPAPPPPLTREVRFDVVGGVVSYAAIARGGVVEDVASVTPHRVPAPAVVVLTVRADTHPLAELAATSAPPLGRCRIWIDGVMADEEVAAGGGTATCVAVLG